VEAVRQTTCQAQSQVKILLDTNALIWWLKDDPKLGSNARSIIANRDSQILVSIVSFWEVTMKWRVGKMEFSGSHLLSELGIDSDVALLQIEPVHLSALDDIEAHHKDPFDHLIIAQAKIEGARIVTSDRDMTLYGVPCIPAMR
jgi:PIN domain nuclease of toxin-antitoxin system